MKVSSKMRRVGATAACVVAYVISVVVSCELTRGAQGVAALWTANAFLICGLLLLPQRLGVAALALCGLGSFGVYAGLGDPLAQAGAYTAINMAECLFTAWAARGVLGASLRLADFNRITRLFGLVIVPAAGGAAAIAATYSALVLGRPWYDVWRSWALADAIGLAIVLPSLLILLRTRDDPDFRRSHVETALHYVAVVLAAFAAFGQSEIPLPFVIYASLTAVAFRLGPRGAVIGGLVTTTLALGLYLTVGPPAFFRTSVDAVRRMHMMQIYCMVSFYAALLMATAVAGQMRLRRLMLRRMRSARAARASALAASSAKTEFLATMSHEIRTPMNSILGFTRLLLERKDLPAPARRQLGLIDSAGESLLTVVNDILDFSKVEAGEVQLHLSPMSLGRLVEDAAAIAGQAAAAKGLELRLRAPEDDGRLYLADEMRLRQVILNLLNNGVKFTKEGWVELAVEVTDEDQFDQVRFTITDTGVGIPLDRRDKLFERFSQVDSSVARTYGGTGLGLAICKGLVELMDGAIGVRSAPGRGSSFWFETPLSRCEAEAAAETEESTQSVGGARVLLVDDHPMNRELGAALLALLGCDVDLAVDGAAAVQAARTGDYDLILMDVHMPVMDGLTAARAIKASAGPEAQTPIVAMTADVLPEHVERCRQAGMVDHVAKPVRPEALHAALVRNLPSPERRDALSQARRVA
ncbi:MAG TPA: ATP-binding protein [Caulobacteraceae bacterium]|nr:ATP-binding protein [Caulobacteraceae bacterium]